MGEALLVRCGTIEAGFAYDLPTRTLTVHILQAKEVPSKERGGAANTQVSKHMQILGLDDQYKIMPSVTRISWPSFHILYSYYYFYYFLLL